MAKLKQIIKQLSDKDYQSIIYSLEHGGAEKSAFLLRAMRERKMNDKQIMEELEVNSNAYYVLRSRLNQKIEEHLLKQVEGPRTELLKKVANVYEIMFSERKTLAIATLRKLEKALLHHDLSNELTMVYKALKKLHEHTPEHYLYAQQYNQHVAYMVAIDQMEDQLSDYFVQYGHFLLSEDPLALDTMRMLRDRLLEQSRIYDSHRPWVYARCADFFHRLHVESRQEDLPALVEGLQRMAQVLQEHHPDPIYHQVAPVCAYLQHTLELAQGHKAPRQEAAVLGQLSDFLSNGGYYSFPPQFLLDRLQQAVQQQQQEQLWMEAELQLKAFLPNTAFLPHYLCYSCYRALCAYYAGRFAEAARWLNTLLNEVNLRRYPAALIQIKTLLTLQYACMQEDGLVQQLANNIQRQVRLHPEGNYEDVLLMLKLCRLGLMEGKRDRISKAQQLIYKLRQYSSGRRFDLLRLLPLDMRFVGLICRERSLTEEGATVSNA